MRQAGIHEPQGLSNAAHDPKTAIDRRKLRQTRSRKNNPQILFPIFQENQCEERDQESLNRRKRKPSSHEYPPKHHHQQTEKKKAFAYQPTRLE
jgi:hypothetical protein